PAEARNSIVGTDRDWLAHKVERSSPSLLVICNQHKCLPAVFFAPFGRSLEQFELRTRMDSDSYLHVLERIHDGRDKPCNLPLPLLRSITEDFSDKRKIGCGGCGEVYKGFVPNGTAVAVKRLFNHRTVDEQLFLREVQSMMSVQHQNVVRFLGYCSNTEQIAMNVEGKYILADVRERLLCFEYVSNGSLENHLTDELRGLEWHTRYQIIRGICEGLLHLHKENRIIHMDLKPANILLDNHMIPKIADFGLSRLDDASRTMTTNRLLSLRYCAPEYIYDGKMSLKSDIYSLGIIIMELVTGSYNVNPNATNILRRWSQRWKLSVKQPPLVYQQVRKCIELALTCVEKDPQARPFIWDIITVLNQMENGEQEIPCLKLEDMLGIEPLELHFSFELNKKKTCLLKLTNDSEDYIAFNIQMATQLFSAQPNIGIVPPRSRCNVNITLQPLEEAPAQKHYTNEFTVQSRRVDWGLTAKDISTKMFNNKDVVEMVDEVNLTVVFDEPLVVGSCSGDRRNQCEYCSSTQAQEEAPQVDIPCIEEKTSSPDTPMNDDKVSINEDILLRDGKVSTNTTEKFSGNPSGEVMDMVVKDAKYKKDLLSRSSSANPSEEDSFTSSKLVHVDPLELRYPFELNKKFDCSVKMSNRTDDHVAFKFKKNTNVDFLVVPNKKGILPPRSTQEFVITMVAHQRSDMQEKGQIVVWSTIVSNKDDLICEGIFRNTPGRVVQRVQLDIIYVAPALAQCPLWDEFMNSLVSAPLSLPYNGRQKDDNNQQVEDKSKGSEGRTTQQVRRQGPSDQLLDVQPPELRHFFQPNKLMSCSLQLTNNSDEEMAFRFKQMNGRQQSRLRFASMPLQGIVAPKSTYTVIFITQKQQELPQEEDFDLVLQSGVVTEQLDSTLKSDNPTHPFDCDACSVKVHEVTLKSVFAYPQQDKEITSGVTRSIIETELLDIYPEPGCLRPNIIDLRFSNKTDDDVYFFIMLSNNNPAGEKEMEGPLCRGSVMPRSTCRVTVTMKQQACRILMTTSRSLQQEQLPYDIELLSDIRDMVFKSVKENGGKAHEVSLMVVSNYEPASNQTSSRTQLKVDIPSCNLANVTSIDVHTTKPWIVTAHGDGNVCIWKISDHAQDGYQYEPVAIKTPEFSPYYRALSVKFVARRKWVVHGDNYGYISVHEYNTTTQVNQVTKFRAHLSAVRSLAVHPIHPYVLSASDDRVIKLWDWDNGWVCAREFRGHSGPVLQVKFNPKDTDTFASVSNLLGATETGGSASNLMDSADEHANIKIWTISSSRHIEDLRGRFSAVEYYLRRITNQPCLAIGKEGGATEIWDLQKRGCAPPYLLEKPPIIIGQVITVIACHPTH
ncbi:hypothetical protein U9M48_004634, partial [Paspalum notatum var. saurae]